jgi:hypothetical protein
LGAETVLAVVVMVIIYRSGGRVDGEGVNVGGWEVTIAGYAPPRGFNTWVQRAKKWGGGRGRGGDIGAVGG